MAIAIARRNEMVLRIRAEAREAQREIRNTAAEARGLGQAARQQAAATGAANRTLLDLSRFANDAQQFQFGLRQGLVATANQFDGLVLSWRAMKAEAAAAGTTVRSQFMTAMKGAGGALIGAQVAALAFSAAAARVESATRGAAEAGREAADSLVQLRTAGREAQEMSEAEIEALIERAQAYRQAASAGLDYQAVVTAGAGVLGQWVAVLLDTDGATARARRRVEEYGGFIEDLESKLRRARVEQQLFNEVVSGSRASSGSATLDPDFVSAAGAGTLDPSRLFRTNPWARRTPSRRTPSGRGRRERTMADVERDLARTRAVIAGLLDLGVTAPAAAAEAQVSALASAVEDALGVTRGETTDGVRALTEALMEARQESARLAIAEERRRAEQRYQDSRFSRPIEVRGPGRMVAALEQEALARRNLARSTAEGRAEMEALLDTLIEVEPVALRAIESLSAVEVVGLRALRRGIDGAAESMAAFVDGFLFGVARLSEAERQLAQLQFQEEAARLRELWAEGEIGAQQYRLEMEVLNERQAEFEASFDRIKQAVRSFGEAFRSVLRQIIADLTFAIAKALLLRALGSGSGGGFFTDVLTIFAGGNVVPGSGGAAGKIPGGKAGKTGGASIGPDGSLQVRAGGQVLTVQFDHRFGEMRLHGDTLAAGVERSRVAHVAAGSLGDRAYKRRG